ncbi:MAG TPA: hypothetical protein VKX28_20575 [Xanthobacteraceae bacterium]|nr:hypothetical protein [Xanthobacteraceae bacterium]
MADYYPLIAKAVAGLDKSTGEARRTLYVRAREALVTQLRGVVPALSESEITRERLALEEAIRKVEAEAARKSRFDPPPERKRVDGPEPPKSTINLAPQPPRPAAPASNGQGEQDGSEGSTLSGTAADLRRRNPAPPERSTLSNDGLQGFRNVVADAEDLGDATAQGSRAAREAYNQMPAPSPEFDRLEPRLEPDGLRARERRPSAREQRRDPPREQPPPPSSRSARPPARDGYPREPVSRDMPARDGAVREPRRDRSPPPPPPRERPPGRNSAGSRDGNSRATLRDMDDFDRSSQMEPARADEFSAHDFANDFDAAPTAAPDFDFDAAQGRGRGRRRAEAMESQARHHEADARPRGRLLAYLAILVVLMVIGGGAAYEWRPIVATMRGLVASRDTPPPAPQENPPGPSQKKFNDRINSNDSAAQPGPQSAQNTQNADQGGAAVAQRVLLYEEDPNDPQGKRFAGSAVWHLDNVSPGANQPPEPVVRADIEIPERKMTVKWVLKRNTDKTLPASHTIEITVSLPPDFPHGGIKTIAGQYMKDTEDQLGVPLAGYAVKVTDTYFLIGLSAVDSEQQHNIELLKKRPWFDMPIVFNDGRRAILAVEKGVPGDRILTAAFAGWKQ